MKRFAVACVWIALAFPLFGAGALRIVSAGPVGTTATLEEANEIRVVFSEPMVTLGRIPQQVAAPFFHIEPAVSGTFRWSGTTTLIFTPARPLPHATRFTVTIDSTAKSASGNALDQPYRWTFTTPTLRLLRTDWYRTTNGAVVIGLRFNQPVSAGTLVAHLQLATQKHDLDLGSLTPEAAPKRAKAAAAASADRQSVLSFVATEWNRKRFEPGPDLVVLETKPGIPPDTWIQVLIDGKLAPSAVQAPTGELQTYTIELEPTFFVSSVECEAQCDPEDRNGINFRGGVRFANVKKALTVTDVTDPAHPAVLPQKKSEATYDYPSWSYGLDELGYSMQPAHTYQIRIDPSLTAEDGQTLGYVFNKRVEYWHKSAFVSFGSGHGVWESSGGSVLPFSVRNFRSVKQWLVPLKIEELMPAMVRLRANDFGMTPEGEGKSRTLNVPRDRISAVGFDLAPAIGSDNRGLAWAAIEPGEAMPQSRIYDPRPVSTLVQATNLGISVKDSPLNTVILVTHLDDATPVEGAAVSIRDTDNKVVWRGTTDAHGIAVAPGTDLRRRRDEAKNEEEWDDSWAALEELHFAVIAEKDGDVAYVGSDWNEGIRPWEFETRYDVTEADPQLRGTIFADRGVYKLGEEVHFKLIARTDTPEGIRLLAAGTKVDVTLRDSHARDIDSRTVELNAWSSADWTYRIPQDAPLGSWSVIATSSKQVGTINGGILVAAYRRPDFRVDAAVDADRTLAGTQLHGTVTGRYLFGGPMSGKAVKWTWSKQELTDPPRAIAERWPSDRYAFLGHDWQADYLKTTVVAQNDAKLDAKGELRVPVDTEKGAGVPFEYRFEGVVTDVTRQQIAGRAAYRVDTAPWYIGVRRPPYFAEAAKGIDTEIVAAGLDGLAVAGVNVKLELARVQWSSVRQAEGQGFYEWQTVRKEVAAGEWNVTTQTEPVPLHIPLSEGGEYLLTARAEADGRSTTTRISFYAVGEGYTAWQRNDHNRIELVPEKRTYRPGDTARIMIKSPWEHATALLTTEREGVRTWKPFDLTSTQQTVTVPITDKDIPNLYVSVLLVKGRTRKEVDRDGNDPGKPAFRLGYVELKVEDASKRLDVGVKANRDEFRPATKATIEVNVRDAAGKPSQSEVTLWAVDYGVLSLTGYTTPDVIDSVYLEKALQVANEDSRQRIVSRRVLTPKGASDGGGGGRDAGPGTLRKDFRVLAFWVGSLVTDAKGRARKEVTLPESLTTYRIMAVAADRQSRFGSAQAEVRVNKPLMLTPAWPRFLAVGDKAHFGGVVHSQLTKAGSATVSIESLDPEILSFAATSATAQVPATGQVEVRFDAVAHAAGEARLRMRVVMGRENDALEDIIPVRVLVSPETVAAYGEAKPNAEEKIELPRDVVPGYGGLRVDLSSTALSGLSEGARYLIEYPYGCAEQRASRSLALMLTADLGEAFAIQEVDAAKQKATVQSSLRELETFQCGDGGFAFWPGQCSATSPYLSSNVVHVFQRAKQLGYVVSEPMLARAYEYLENRLSEPPPTNEGWRPAYNAWQAFAVKVLAEGGRNGDSHFNRVYEYRERMPVFALSFLVDALQARKETSGARHDDLHRRITNAIPVEGGQAHVEELNDPYLLWFWNSNVRSTAIVTSTLARNGSDEELVKRMVRWLMTVRKNGRWNDTQENAWALEALVDYYRRYESEVPDFLATVTLGSETIARETFKGRTTEAKSQQFSMQQLLAKGAAGQQMPLVFSREGTGTLFYMTRLRYAANVLQHDPLDRGFRVERSYALQNGAAATSFKAGDLIEVTLRIRNTKERRYVAITDPVPAGTEPVESWFATTASALAEAQQRNESRTWWEVWERGGFDYVERHDDRVNVFATRLGTGEHVFKYLVRATTAGTFIASPAHAEEMYEPEVFGRTPTSIVEIAK